MTGLLAMGVADQFFLSGLVWGFGFGAGFVAVGRFVIWCVWG